MIYPELKASAPSSKLNVWVAFKSEVGVTIVISPDIAERQ
jgi:hypothetical protein